MLLSEVMRARPPHDIALRGDAPTTFGALADSASRWTSTLRDSLPRGSLVLIALREPADAIAAMAGAQDAGVVPASLNVHLPIEVIHAICERVEPAAWIGDSAPAGVRVLAPGTRSADPLPMADDEDALVVFTSGTTAVPRGRAFTAGALRAAHACEVADDPQEPGVVLAAMPLGNLFMATRLASIFDRGGSVVPLTRWDVAAALRAVRDHGVSTIPGVPTHFVDLLAEPDRGERVRRCVIGGAAPPPGLVRALRERFGCEVVLRYSTTETGAIASTGPVTDDGAPLRPLPGVEIEIEIEDGRAMVRSPMASRGEWNGAPSAAWIDTNDLGVLDADGGLYLRGRADDAFARGGTTIVPSEIEAVLHCAPGVNDVVVIGEEDARLGMRAIAFVVGAVSPQDVERHAREHLAAYLVPDEIRVLDEIPRTVTGKVDRRALEDL